MVHNVAGAEAWLADGELLRFGRVDQASGPRGAMAAFVKGLAEQHRAEIEAHWPKVLRRVAGYNLDLFHNAERAALHRRRQRQPGAPADGQRRHAGVHASRSR